MKQLIINIEDESVGILLRKLIKSLNGVSIAKQVRKKKCGLDRALEDVAAGRISRFDSKEEFYRHFGL